jgi:AMMECR1 domain-containing protein
MSSLYAKIAKQAAEHYAKTGEYLDLKFQLPQELLRQKACYVIITEDPGHHMRAMHGSPLPSTPRLAQEIVKNTVNAIIQQGMQIRPIDAARYTYTVGVLGFMERITSREHLMPLVYGLYIRSDMNKSSVLLPRRVGIETADEQIATAIREAHIDPHHEVVTMYRFPVIFYGI